MEKIDKIKYKLDRIWREIRYPFRQIWFGVDNLRFWLPKIWKTRDWDHYYMLEFFIWKMQRHRRYQEKWSRVVAEDRDRQIDTMTQCIDLFTKVNNEWENYEEPASDEFHNKWGELQIECVPSKSHPGSFELIDLSDKGLSEDELKQKHEDFIKSNTTVKQARKADFERAMSIFVENFDSWWD